MEPRTIWAAGGQPQAAPHYTDAQRAARAAACPVARGQPDRSEYDEWGRHKDYVEPVESDDGLGASIHGSRCTAQSPDRAAAGPGAHTHGRRHSAAS